MSLVCHAQQCTTRTSNHLSFILTSDPEGNFHFLPTFSALEAAQAGDSRARAAFLSVTFTSVQEQSLGAVGTSAGTTLLR